MNPRVQRILRWMCTTTVGLTTLLCLVVSSDSHARLNPYNVTRTSAATTVAPRILFVVDTSGSMGERARSSGGNCTWYNCEGAAGTTDGSRIAAARQVINSLVETHRDTAKFSLMTFDQRTAHTSLPGKCDGHRFDWATDYRLYFTGSWWDLFRLPSQEGFWKLCQGTRSRPYPYLRWDELGYGVSMSNSQTGDLPASPIVATADLSNSTNADRRVQWFPSFMGVRFQPNDTTDPDRSITYSSIGDYGTSSTDKDANVWGNDFYYWPYVDGFPGYGAHRVRYLTGYSHDRAGVASEGSVSMGHLWAPFYLDLSGTTVPTDDYGPGSLTEAADTVSYLTSPLIEGGIDIDGNTPWRSVIGTVPASPTNSNAQFSHTSVASYAKFVKDADTPDACAPIAVILLSDGLPSPSSEGGSGLYARLAALRNDLDIPTYVVGMFESGSQIHNMACAAAGACDGTTCSSPCDDTPADGWDTCETPGSSSSCGYTTDSTEELSDALGTIVSSIVALDVETGTGATVNEFTAGVQNNETTQTRLRAFTEVPAWRGHVVRAYCDDEDESGDLESYCVPPDPEFSVLDVEPTFGPCPQSRTWDAGECLAMTTWNERRVYTHDSSNTLIPILEEGTSEASAAFVAELTTQGLLTSSDIQAEANELAAFLLGRDAPGGWKLPGLGNSAPVVVRRVPRYDANSIPEVEIRDPHCGGRVYDISNTGALPESLYDFSREAWDPQNQLTSPESHYEYQEAVLVGDDIGVLHAFGMDHGNELWGFVPRFALTGIVEQAAIGAPTMGQPSDLDEHIFGVSGTVNQGFVHDDGPDDIDDTADDRWIHLGVFGMGGGGAEYAALDLSHMSPSSASGPFEILWTSEDSGLKRAYDAYNGETWARPALSFHVAKESIASPPDAFLVMGSGYTVDNPVPVGQGRTLVRADALTGEIQETAVLPAVTHRVYESNFGALVDPAVGSHCLSRFWAEAQETYIADPAGRLFRWDLGRDTAHAADSGGTWGDGGTAAVVDSDAPFFPVCLGAGDTCSISVGSPGEPFTYAPSVSGRDRLDNVTGTTIPPKDEFLVALVGGSTKDGEINGITTGLTYHSSVYILVDDHSEGDAGDGFEIPTGAPLSTSAAGAGSDLSGVATSKYFRAALSSITRTRRVTPYTGATEIVETRTFSRQARPVRAPRIVTTGVLDDSSGTAQVIEGIEVIYIEFIIYEPPTEACDSSFYDAANDTWHIDRGSSYLVRFRLTADASAGFDLTTGSESKAVDFGDSFARGLVLESVEQLGLDSEDGGNTGPIASVSRANKPCTDDEAGANGIPDGAFSIPLRTSKLSGFTPLE